MSLSIVDGPKTEPLWNKTIGVVLQEQVNQYASEESVVVSWQHVRLSYSQLELESSVLARALLSSGVCLGDRISVMAGNRIEYILIVLAAARIGAVLCVINNTYTESELVSAIRRTGERYLFPQSPCAERSTFSCRGF